ncbi:hypothetical protein C8R43DRAFT_1032939 [Mycena crocata]|nr:hypothetical protein C8R43DRAFT_1032939 [Mycena crocata]
MSHKPDVVTTPRRRSTRSTVRTSSTDDLVSNSPDDESTPRASRRKRGGRRGSSSESYDRLLEAAATQPRSGPVSTWTPPDDLTLDASTISGPPQPDGNPISLIDFLRIPPPVVPEIYAAGKLTSTKSIPSPDSDSDDALDPAKRLRYVVPFAHIMEPLIAHVRTKHAHLVVDPSELVQRDWLVSHHPARTSRWLPLAIHSEKDSEVWAFCVLLRPSLAAFHAATSQQFEETDNAPNLTSGGGGGAGASIPDGMLWSEGKLKATFEMKTHAAFVDRPHAKGNKKQTFKNIIGTYKGMPLGCGIRYVWPDGSDRGVSKADKMLGQVWLQMIAHDVEVASLTNYSSIIFFFRKGQHLFMSGEYTRNDNILLVTFAFLAYALGEIPKNVLKLPTVHEEWWEPLRKFVTDSKEKANLGNRTLAGLDDSTMPAAMEKLYRLAPHLIPKRDEHLHWVVQ